MAVQVGPCDPWPVNLCCDLPDDLDPAIVTRWQAVASQTLWRMSGMRWGPCPVTVRPCRRSCLDDFPRSFQSGGSTGGWVPYIGTDGAWRNASVCGCSSSSCSCGELCEVKLAGPVYDVVSVDVDGTVLLPEAYRVDSPGLLVRTDGECWPTCQDMALPEGEPNTFTVTYRWGLPLDEAAIAAVSDLTCELVKSCLPAGTCGPCRLPGNVTKLARQGTTTATRQGVTVTDYDPSLLFTQGRTGLLLVDLWLTTVNPYRLTSPSRAYSPDYKQPRVTTWP